MTEVEEPQFSSLKDRINALNQQKSATTTTFGKRAPPPVPPAKSTPSTTDTRPHPPAHVQTINNPPLPSIGSAVDKAESNLPAGKFNVLPPPPVDRDLPIPAGRLRSDSPVVSARNTPPVLPGRKASQPGLPPRNDVTQQQEERRGSNASVVSYTSNLSLTRTKTGGSTTSASSVETGRKLPPTFEKAKLPPLPPSRKQQLEQEVGRDVKVPLVSTRSAPVVPIRPVPAQRDSQPQVPSRPQLPSRTSTAKQEEPIPDPRKLPPASTTSSAKSALSMGFSNKYKPTSSSTESKSTPSLLTQTRPSLSSASSPPPIPLSSKPSQAAIAEVQNRPPPPPRDDCLRCRDFSRPDQLASLHPRETLPRSHDYPAYLASVLCAPFPSPTDKARAIFTWCHHNIAYDTYSLFNNCVKHQEPSDTITSGLGVCAGYAGAFAAIALKAGLECVMVTGHGKGYGHTPLKPGEPVPVYKGNHAWNAVRIDDGQWKLIDSCWGAGNVGADQVYNKHFTPAKFTMSNEDFGLEHYPENSSQFYRADGSVPTWEEYCVGPMGRDAGEKVTVYSNSEEEHGILATSYSPVLKDISLSKHRPDEVLRFQFSNICEHWNHVKHGKGKPYPLVLCIGGVDGRKEDFVPVETNGYWWWCDVRVKDLGCRGKEVKLMAVHTVSGKDVRGWSNRQFRERGNVGYSFMGIATWKLV